MSGVCVTEVGIADAFAKQPEPTPRHAHPVDLLSPAGSGALGQIHCLPSGITSELIPLHGLISSETTRLAPHCSLWLRSASMLTPLFLLMAAQGLARPTVAVLQCRWCSSPTYCRYS